jgi:NAD(P)-dependent dehydrogenase (short-subunit alcohol dehydrogenase family)
MARRVLITGATSGIGLEAARALAAQGMAVVIVGRDPVKTQRVAAELSRGQPEAVEYLLADLQRMASVRRLAAEYRERYGELDVLINNAGSFFSSRTVTEDSLEATFALNHLAPFLLTHLLLDLITAAPAGRVVTVSSAAHVGARMHWDDLQLAKRYSGFTAYGQSKLANLLFSRELARRLAGTKATSNALHPGAVATSLFDRGTNGALKLALRLIRPFMLDPVQGARTTVYLASSPQVADVSGLYFVKEKPAAPSRQAQDDAAAARLWSASEELLSQ